MFAAVLLVAGGCGNDDGPLFGATTGAGAATGSGSGVGGGFTTGNTTANGSSVAGTGGSMTGTGGSATGTGGSMTGTGGSMTGTGGSMTGTGGSTTGTGGSATGTGGSATGTGGSTTGTGGGATGSGGGSTGSGGASTGMGGASTASGTGGGTSTSSGSGGAGGGCTTSSWYCDGDMDGFGDPAVMELACIAPPGNDAICPGPYVANPDDCGPGDAMAHPGQMQYFNVKPMPPGPTPAFDYDCSGVEEKDPSQLYNMGMNTNCFMECIFNPNPPQGFGPNAVCGGTDEYYRCSSSFFGCMLTKIMPPAPLRCH